MGPAARPNSLVRILTGERCTLTLSAESRFYYTLHRDVSEFIRTAIDRNLTGIYNVCSSESVALGDVARRVESLRVTLHESHVAAASFDGPVRL